MMETIKDSGERRDAGTGSVRDKAIGKGRFDLVPLDIAGKLIGSQELVLINKYKYDGNTEHIYSAIELFAEREGKDFYTMMIELSQHYEAGCAKYGDNNWMLGQPLSWYLDSGVRHYNKHMRGDTDEPHDRAFVWNMFGIIWTHENRPAMIDLPFAESRPAPPKPGKPESQTCGNCAYAVQHYESMPNVIACANTISEVYMARNEAEACKLWQEKEGKS